MYNTTVLYILYAMGSMVHEELCINVRYNVQEPATTNEETEMAWMTCRLCLNFSQKINAQFQEHDTKDGQNGKETQLESEDIIRTTQTEIMQRLDEKQTS